MYTDSDFKRQVPVITFSDVMFAQIEKYAKSYNMSPYYFVKIIAARFITQRTNISIVQLMKDEKATQVVEQAYLDEEDSRTSVVGNGLTELFWNTLQKEADVYDMDQVEFFRYIILRYLEDKKNKNLNSDLPKAFGLRSNNDE